MCLSIHKQQNINITSACRIRWSGSIYSAYIYSYYIVIAHVIRIAVFYLCHILLAIYTSDSAFKILITIHILKNTQITLIDNYGFNFLIQKCIHSIHNRSVIFIRKCYIFIADIIKHFLKIV